MLHFCHGLDSVGHVLHLNVGCNTKSFEDCTERVDLALSQESFLFDWP